MRASEPRGENAVGQVVNVNPLPVVEVEESFHMGPRAFYCVSVSACTLNKGGAVVECGECNRARRDRSTDAQ
jgi:hypothetical protein